jgi:uncharacterized OB-fold protein
MNLGQPIPIAEGLFTWPSKSPRLIGSECRECGVVSFPARSGCPSCCAADPKKTELGTEGTLWTYTVQRFPPNRPPYDGPEDFEPFAVGYVELPGQVKVQTRIKTNDLSRLEIGTKMSLVVEKYIERDGKDVVAYFFTPTDER